jgi:signal transduction histidine kinase
MCRSIAQSLGFERVTLLRRSGEQGRLERLAEYGLALHDSAASIHTADANALRRALRTRSPVLVQQRPPPVTGPPVPRDADIGRPTVVVPLFSGAACLGFLVAEWGGGEPLALGASRRRGLTRLGTVAATLLEQAIVRDDLVNAIRLRNEFIALASHELRTPVAAVCGTAATLVGSPRTPGSAQEHELLGVLRDQATRLQALVEQLLDLSRLEAASIRITPKALAVRERTEEIIQAVGGSRAGEIMIHIDPRLRVPADPYAFDRIVSNLIGNACRYGRPPITVTAVANDHHFRFVVEDRGSGVAEDFAPRLFERFTRPVGSAVPGSGLGLSIAQAYAHAHGGQVSYTEASPHGARFELIVPIPSQVPRTPEPIADAPVFETGQAVWIDGRAASFGYTTEAGSAVIRYDGEAKTRVVPLRKVSSASPPAEDPIPAWRSRVGPEGHPMRKTQQRVLGLLEDVIQRLTVVSLELQVGRATKSRTAGEASEAYVEVIERALAQARTIITTTVAELLESGSTLDEILETAAGDHG